MPTSSTAVHDVPATSDEGFRPSKSALVSADLSDFSSSPSSSISGMTEAFNFSSGNPRIEEIRGVVHLFRDAASSSPSTSTSALPVERKPLVCVLGVPNYMTYADFCQFCGSFIHEMLEMRVVRGDEMEDRYSILIRFRSQDSADNFYKHLNGRRYSSLEAEVCCLLFMVDVQYTASIEHAQASIEHAQASPASSTEQPTCPVCLDRLDQETSGILTTICNHSFHCSCISKWTDSSCPVCRYCQQQPEKSICFICQTSENLWICVICGFVGCGKYKEGHAKLHWKDTQHCYSLELETQRVWDHAGDNYVHRLIQSKTDGKLVELNSQCGHVSDACLRCGCEDAATSEALLNSRVELIVNEYNELLTGQLENQRLYFDSMLREVREEIERDIFRAIKKAISPKLQKMQAKLDKCIEEKTFLDDLNENLLKNQEIWERKVLEMEEREKITLEAKDKKIQHLEAQLGDLMQFLETCQQMEQLSLSSEPREDASTLSVSETSSSKSNGQGSSKSNKKKR